MARVDRHGPLRGQRVLQPDRQRARIDSLRVAGVVIPVETPRAARDPLCQRRTAPAGTAEPASLQFDVQCTRDVRNVPHHAEVNAMMGADGVGVVVDLDNGRARVQQPAVPRGPHVERDAGAEHHVRLTDQLGRRRRRETARNPERPRTARKQTVGHRRRCQQSAQALRQFLQWHARARIPRSSAGDDERPPRTRQCVRYRVQGVGSYGATLDQRDVGWGIERTFGTLQRLHVERHHQYHRALLEARSPIRPQRVGHRGFGAVQSVRRGADRSHQLLLRDTEIRANRGGGGVARQHQDRRTALGRLRQAGHRVGEARSLVDTAHAHLAADLCIRVRHRDGRALVPCRDEQRTARDQRVGGHEISAADQSERSAHPTLRQRPSNSFGDQHGGRDPAQCCTSASTRAGLPEPRTIGNGAVTSSVPVAGRRARFASCVSPYFFAPSKY